MAADLPSNGLSHDKQPLLYCGDWWHLILIMRHFIKKSIVCANCRWLSSVAVSPSLLDRGISVEHFAECLLPPTMPKLKTCSGKYLVAARPWVSEYLHWNVLNVKNESNHTFICIRMRISVMPLSYSVSRMITSIRVFYGGKHNFIMYKVLFEWKTTNIFHYKHNYIRLFQRVEIIRIIFSFFIFRCIKWMFSSFCIIYKVKYINKIMQIHKWCHIQAYTCIMSVLQDNTTATVKQTIISTHFNYSTQQYGRSLFESFGMNWMGCRPAGSGIVF